MRSMLGILIVMAALAGLLACYPHTAPVPCPNIMNCPDDPTVLPPVTDATRHDGGQDR